MSAMRQALLGIVLSVALAVSSGAFADTVTVAPTGEYAQIDTRLAIQTMQILGNGTAQDKQRAIEMILAHPENYAPPVSYVLSSVLFHGGKKDEAAFWFYAGQLRARFDANRCADVSARSAAGVLNQQFGPAINAYAFADPAKLEALIPKVVEWDRKTPHNYDHRWINLHGMDAMISGLSPEKAGSPKPLSLPKEQWDVIAEKTRMDYLEDFEDGMAKLKTGADRMGDYAIRHGEVFFRNEKVKGADAASFQYLGGGYGKDKTHVFYVWHLVEGAGVASFVPLGDEVARDAKAVYYREKRCEECDPASFRKAGNDWYTDKNAAYERFGFHGIPGIDQQSFIGFNHWFAKDRRTVFYMTWPVRGADPETFKLQSCGESEVNGEDKNRCYWNQHPVPCDCKTHNMGEFPPAWTPLAPGMSLLAETGPIALASVKGSREGGYFAVAPGRRPLMPRCWNGKLSKNEDSQFVLDIEPGKMYRLERDGDEGCAVKVKRSALIRGKPDGPEIRLAVPGSQEPQWQAELAPGKQTLTAICREVTRDRVTELPVSLTLDLEAGSIYQLRADFNASQGKCDVNAAVLAR